MSMEKLINDLYDMLDGAARVPLSKDKAVLSVNEVKDILDEIRANLPQEIRQAKNVVADRNNIISQAEQKAESMIRSAEERAKKIVSKSEIVRQAQQRANEMLSDAKLKSTEMRSAANKYIDDLMKKADDEMSANLAELKKTRQNIRASQRRG